MSAEETVEVQTVSETVPFLLFATTCEDVTFSGIDREPSLQRIGRCAYADTFPAVLDRLVIVSIWSGGQGTFRVTSQVRAPFKSEEELGEVIASESYDVEFRPEVIQYVHFYRADGIELSVPGAHFVEILLDGSVIYAFPYVVVDVSEEQLLEEAEEDSL